MHSIRHLRENNDDRLSVLVEAGLFEESRLSLLRKALDENNHKMSKVERKALLETFYRLLDHVAGSETETLLENQTKTKNIDINEMPALLILKRRAIRVFPDGQKVALYWADRINKYVTVPFEGTGLSEESLPVASRYSAAKNYLQSANEPASQNYKREYNSMYSRTKSRSTAAGYALGSLFRDKVINKAYLSMRQRRKENQQLKNKIEPNLNENFMVNLRMLREQSLADDAADVLIPGVSAFKNFQKGDWGAGLIDAGVDVASIAAGALTGGLGYAAIKALKAGTKVAKIANKASKAAKIAKKSSKGILNKIGAGAGKIGAGVAGAAALAAAAAGTGGAGGNNSPADIYGKDRPRTGFQNNTQGINPFHSGEMRNSTGYWDTPVGRRQLYKNAGGGMVAPPANLYEGNLLEELREMVKKSTKTKDINGITITQDMAKNIVQLHEALNTDNKKILEEEIKTKDGFFEILNFSVRN